MADEYYDLVNRECYAPSIVGRILTQKEVDNVISQCNAFDDGQWGEEHLIEVLKKMKGN